MRLFVLPALTYLMLLSTAIAEFDQRYQLWTEVLESSVVTERPTNTVKYKVLRQNPKNLHGFVKSIEEISAAEYSAFNKNQKISFLVNAYNALTLKLVLEHYPVTSIKKIGGFFGSPWKIEFFTLFGERRNLDYIEHEVLRQGFDEPRIHFAIVCAARGCPSLQRKPFVAETLDRQLEDATEEFLRNSARNYFSEENSTLMLSKIFSWFEEDFKTQGSGVKSFVASRMSDDAQIQARIRSDATDIRYLDYDWSLNEATYETTDETTDAKEVGTR